LDIPEDKQKAAERFFKGIQELEQERKSRIYSIVHTSAPAHLCHPEVGSLIRGRKQLEGIDTLELLIHSPGGHPDVAYKLMRHFRRTCKKVNVLVPLLAKSAATLMSVGADAQYMGQLAEFGPIDIQLPDPVEAGEKPVSPLDEFKSMEFLGDYAIEMLDLFSSELQERHGMSVRDSLAETIPCVTGMMKPLYESVNPIVMGEHRRALAIGEEYSRRLLEQVGNPHAADIVHQLVWGYPSHEFVIDIEEAKSLHLPVHALDQKQEDLLINLIMELDEHDLSYSGFAQLPKPAAKSKAAKPSKPAQSAKKRLSDSKDQSGTAVA
jgi:hypothetical protein